MLPMLILFVFASFDVGLLLMDSTAIENATRAAVLDTSKSASTLANSALACADVLAALNSMPNRSSFSSSCASAPLTVSAQSASGLDGSSGSLVSVSYTAPPLVPVPWMSWLNSTFAISRTAQMRCRKP